MKFIAYFVIVLVATVNNLCAQQTVQEVKPSTAELRTSEAQLKKLAGSQELQKIEADGRKQMEAIENSAEVKQMREAFEQQLRGLQQDASHQAQKAHMEGVLREAAASPELKLHQAEVERAVQQKKPEKASSPVLK